MTLMIAEYVVRVAVEIDDPDDRSDFLISAAQQPVSMLIGQLQIPDTVSVKLIRSGTKGNYSYTDPILSRASRRRAWKAIRKNRSDAAPDNTSLETVITSGIAAAVGDAEAVAEAATQVEQEAAADAAAGNGEAADAEGPAAPPVAAADQPAEDNRPQ